MKDYMPEHKPHFGVAYFVRLAEVGQGDVLSFMYKNKQRWVFVLNPNYEGKMHALTLELTPRSILSGVVIDAMYEEDQPLDLYDTAVYKVAKDFDSYRTYFVNEIKQPRRIPYYLTAKPKLRKN